MFLSIYMNCSKVNNGTRLKLIKPKGIMGIDADAF